MAACSSISNDALRFVVGVNAKRLSVVDPHLHLWDRQAVRYPWLDNAGVAFSGDNRLLPDPYGVSQLRHDAVDVNLQMSVHVEANPENSLSEVRWLQSLADDPANGGHPHGIVAYVDLAADEARSRLDELAAHPNLRGIRQILNVHQDAKYDYVGRHFMRESRWRENLSQLARWRWSFDLQLYPSQVDDALAVIDANPGIAFILNHAGMFVDRNSVSGWREWRGALRRMADRSNTAVKISGLAMFDHAWTVESLRPYVLETIDVFGVDRCMFASNFPIDGLHAKYGQLWMAYAAIVADASQADRDALFCDNAIRHYRLSPPPSRRSA
jgi:predicted TIM-barrel fold metal-dependent hydrolase